MTPLTTGGCPELGPFGRAAVDDEALEGELTPSTAMLRGKVILVDDSGVELTEPNGAIAVWPWKNNRGDTLELEDPGRRLRVLPAR